MTFELLISFVQSLPGCKTKAGLYIVATPIGHLSDISLRALATLAQADLIACEDTRVTKKLLQLYSIQKPMVMYHDHNAKESGLKIIRAIQDGHCVALVSDAGTPLISDPGFDLVNECVRHDLYVTTIPGSNAAVTALTLSGLPSDRFVFLGFLPTKSAARQNVLTHYQSYPETLVLYESPNRVKALLKDAYTVLGNRKVALVRELTKKFEEIIRGSISEVIAKLDEATPKGEFVVLFEGSLQRSFNPVSDSEILDLLERHSTKDAAEQLSNQYGISKKTLYDRILNLKNKKPPIGGS